MMSLILKSYRIKKVITRTLAFECARYSQDQKNQAFWNEPYVLGYALGLSRFNVKVSVGDHALTSFLTSFAEGIHFYTGISTAEILKRIAELESSENQEFIEGSRNATLYGIYLIGGNSAEESGENLRLADRIISTAPNFFSMRHTSAVRRLVWDERIAKGFRFQK